MFSNIHAISRASAVSAIALCSLLGACASSGGTAEYEEKPISHTVTDADRAAAKSKAPIAGDSAVLYVNGMGCPLCATNIDMQLKRLPGVKSVKVDLGVGTVKMDLISGMPHPSPDRLGHAVEDAGFTLVKIEER